MKLYLDIDTDDVSGELYDLLLYAFSRKVEEQGIDPATVSLDDWVIHATVKDDD